MTYTITKKDGMYGIDGSVPYCHKEPINAADELVYFLGLNSDLPARKKFCRNTNATRMGK